MRKHFKQTQRFYYHVLGKSIIDSGI
jgi:hypothetical protein